MDASRGRDMQRSWAVARGFPGTEGVSLHLGWLGMLLHCEAEAADGTVQSRAEQRGFREVNSRLFLLWIPWV